MQIIHEPHDYTNARKDEWLLNSVGNILFKKMYIICNDKVHLAKILTKLTYNFQQPQESYAFAESKDIFIVVNFGTYLTEVSFYYSDWNEEFLNLTINALKDKFKISKNCIRWIYDTYNSSILLSAEKLSSPIQEMYPNLPGSIEQYYRDYLDSSASIIILIGKPGTGKTTWVNGLIKYSEMNARVCYDEKILSTDGAFSDFVDSEDKFFVMEDADNFLRPREDGNTIMHKFLNVGDGIIKTDKKLIFSTNLESIKEIDDALIRPGRCFDVLEFDLLTYDQSTVLLDKIGSDFVIEKHKKYSIAELFMGKNKKVKENSFGFY